MQVGLTVILFYKCYLIPNIVIGVCHNFSLIVYIHCTCTNVVVAICMAVCVRVCVCVRACVI